jgi:ABC-2 type transport system ATP-binding protein
MPSENTGSSSRSGAVPGPEQAALPKAEPGMPAIATFGLTRRFGDLVAVDRLDLSIPAGTIFGLLGSNGAGKSTTLKMLTTLLPPSEGTARVAGCDVVHQAREVRRHIGYVPQMLSADAALTAHENLELSARLYGIPRGERRTRIADALAFMDLSEVGAVLVRKYSGGMIRRLEIAQALLHRPDVVFLDEPTVGLDPIARRAVWERLRDLRSRTATTVLLTTHDMDEAEELCQLVALMHRGRLVVQGSPAVLEAAVAPGASMTEVFVHFTGGTVERGGEYRDVARTRRTASRLG